MKVNTNERKNNKIALNHTNNNTSKKRHIEHWKVVAFYLIIYDIIAVNFSYFFGLWLRFDLRFSNIPQTYLNSYLRFAPFYTVFVLVVFYALHLYKSLWRFASFSELNRIFASSVITTVFHIVCITLLIKRMPISYYVIGAAMQLALVTAIRFAYRYITLERTRRERSVKAVHNVMVIGAGAAGQVILKELKSSTEVLSKPCCVIDDNPNKWDRFMEGVPIVGGRDSIMESVEKYKIDQILLAIPTASPKDKRDILNICKETHCELKSLPGIYQLANGEVSLSRMKAVAVEDLLGRDPIKVNMEEIFQYIKGKTILVTGGGGSIGSELCRQIAGHEPKQLIIFDVYENNAYDIEQELKRKYKDKLNLVVLIGSVRDSRRINMVFEKYKPDIVYHAAAHKHVPLMETSPNEAIKNNVVGTYKTAYAALKHGTQRFVLISTDKAVNPTSIMGASKRLCEMVIQLIGRHSTTEFAAVRFGNVLGSNGSVIPLFKKQIEQGGPVTVTHKDIIRFFMLIPEACKLVLEAGTMGNGGEIFVFDMGKPVRIVDLAERMISLSGVKGIEIRFTGLRDGEKLYEEVLNEEETSKPTFHPKIKIAQVRAYDYADANLRIDALVHACAVEGDMQIVKRMKEIVPEFKSQHSKYEVLDK